MSKAKLFNNGGSQAVRLPADFRFDGEEVDIRRDALTGRDSRRTDFPRRYDADTDEPAATY